MTYEVITTTRRGLTAGFPCDSLEAALDCYEKEIRHANWNVAIYDARGVCVKDRFSDENAVFHHAQKHGEERGGLKSL